MKVLKNTFLFFCFLFVSIHLNGGNRLSVSRLEEQKKSFVMPAGSQDDQLDVSKEGLCICFRLVQNVNTCLRGSEQFHPSSEIFFRKQLFFSKQSYLADTINRINQLENYPLYLHHRCFRI